MADEKKLDLKKVDDSSEFEDINSFFNKLYNTDRKTSGWYWEYYGYKPDSNVFVLLKDKEKIVGTQGMIPIYLDINGKKILSGKSESSLLSPLHRGGNNFTNLYNYALEICNEKQMKVIWGFTSATSVWKRLGFNVFPTIYTSYLAKRPRLAVSTVLKKKWTIGKKISRIAAILGGYAYSMKKISRRQPKKQFSIQNNLKSINDLQSLYQHLKQMYPSIITIDQDEQYLKWRIYNNPFITYQTFFVYNNKQLVAYCYLTKSNDTSYISDLTFLDSAAGEYLLSHILNQVKDSGFVMFYGNIECPTIKKTFDLLKKYGFIKHKQAEGIVIKETGHDENIMTGRQMSSILYDVKNWHMNGLWTEGNKY